jgi:hypothetical protein
MKGWGHKPPQKREKQKMPANKAEIKFRNAVRKAGVSLAAKNDRFIPRLYTYQSESVFLDAELNELHHYDIHYKNAEPVWFTFSNLDMLNSQRLHAAGFQMMFREVDTFGGKIRQAFYKAPEKERMAA